MTHDGSEGVVTWHHGLIARWWANFNVDGPEIDFFRTIVAAGQPALDVGCGTGRLLVPWIGDGLDVDGVDASKDMIDACREAAARAGGEPGLFVQPVHQLDLPRRYGAIVMCGVFGLGGSRDQDREGLRRVFDHLRPGGRLALDYEVAEAVGQWPQVTEPADAGPPDPGERRLGSDGFAYALRHRVVEVDRANRSMVRQLEAWQWRGDELVAHEAHRIAINVWGRTEIIAALEAAGFADVRVVGGYHGGEPTGDDRFVVFLAHRAGM